MGETCKLKKNKNHHTVGKKKGYKLQLRRRYERGQQRKEYLWSLNYR